MGLRSPHFVLTEHTLVYLDLCLASEVHNAKAEECTTPRIYIGSRNIEIKIGGGGLPRNQIVTFVAIAAVC